MAINFPASPTTNQTYTYNGRTWTWNGVGWQATGSTGLTVYTKTTFTATAAQTSFSVTYTVGFVDVYYNGSKLSTSEYTATTGSTVVLGTACAVGDIVETIAWTISSSFNPSLGSASATSLALGGATIGSNALAVTGTTALSGLLTAAGGVSSTLVTDATSSTTGSIITAGGISTQKALWVGTTSQLVGAVSSSAGISNGTAGQISNSISQNSLTSFQVTNSNAGAAAQASYRLYNGNTIADLSVFGTAFTADGVRVANGVALDARPGGAADLALLGTTIRFATSGTTEIARFNTSGFTVGTGTAPALITLNGQSGTGASKGWAILPQVAGVAAGIIGSENYVFGSSDTNIVIQAATGKSVKIFSNAGGAGVTVNSAGTVTMNAYGAGTATFDGSGNITSSDIRIKYDVAEFVTPPGVLEAITPKTFKLISERDNVAVTFDKDGEKTSTPTPIDDTHIGFIANDIQSILPDAVDWSNTEDEILNYSDRALIAVLWNETKALKARLAALEAK